MGILSVGDRLGIQWYGHLRQCWIHNVGVNDLSKAFQNHCAMTYLRDLELLEMAKAKESKNVQVTGEKADFKGFVNVTLTEAHKSAIKSWDLESGDLFDWIATIIAAGHKVSFSYNKQNDTVSASIMCVYKGLPNAGLVVNSYAKDVYSALKALCYKVDHVLPPRWGDYEDAESEMG